MFQPVLGFPNENPTLSSALRTKNYNPNRKFTINGISAKTYLKSRLNFLKIITNCSLKKNIYINMLMISRKIFKTKFFKQNILAL